VDARYIALAVPVFFLLIGVELLVNRARGASSYRLHDAVSSLSCGVGQQVLGIVFFFTARVVGYDLVHKKTAIFSISPSQVGAWLVLIPAVDLCYYAFHRAAHRVNFLWAGHIVHHQSEDYNLSTALRQSWFVGLFVWLFYLPLAVIGFPTVMYLVAVTFNTLYQFWIHTRAIRSLGPLEAVLNTPSHHRVHHGIDPRYIDRNYAGMFIVWDRLFGTFEREEEEPVYGTVKPLASFNPWWANVEDWVRIGRMARATRRIRDKLLVWVMPPEWRPDDLGGRVVIPEVDRRTYQKHEVPSRPGRDLYVIVSFALIVVAATAFLWFADRMSVPGLAAAAAVILVGLLSLNGLVEAKPWAVPLEIARVGASAVLGCLLFWST
jgi:sterol desaturase/sphingolipid hydroxylase (fatty acid hydroxylase superfamily)